MKTETRVGLFILSAISVFFYLSINIRAFRFNKNQYNEYRAFFDDTGGVAVRAVVRIAGVEVGWVENVRLIPGSKAELVLMVHRKNRLAKNAYAMINQDGLIGIRNVEIDPGDPSTGILLPGSTLSMPGKTPVSVGELLEQFRGIATGIQDITQSVKSVVSTRQGEENMKMALDSIAKASNRIADFSAILERTARTNEERINGMIVDLRSTAESLKDGVPKITSAFEDIGHTSVQARDTFKGATEVVDKINTGKGTIGKLINEDETYSELKKSLKGFRQYVTKQQSMLLNVDMHSETMLRETYSKGYFELKLRPNSDFFYVLQLVGDEKGSIKRTVKDYKRKDEKGNRLKASELNMPLEWKTYLADHVEKTERTKDDVLFGLQFGKRFNRVALRIGLFENSFGFGLDFYVPLNTNWFHWISTFEAFDFRGRKRIHDSRPHLKWLNKVYFMKNLYTTFGVDDFVSKQSANPFFGAGLRFGDDDLKYLLSALPLNRVKGS